MTNPDEFLERLEHEVVTLRAASKPTCRAFADLPSHSRTAFAASVRFLGCQHVDASAEDGYIVPELDRVRASELMLLSLYLDSDTPAWSSWVLDRLLEAVMTTPGGSVGDLFHALMKVLCDHRRNLTECVANLIRALVVKCFTEHRESYQSSDFRWMLHSAFECPTPAKTYLALLAIPPEVMDSASALKILRELSSTPYFEEAINTLEDDLDPAERQVAYRIAADRSLARIGEVHRAENNQTAHGEVQPLDVQASLEGLKPSS